MRRSLFAAAVIALSAIATSASAQWKINEFQSDSTGSPDSQYVEFYNATAGQSVTGLTFICIRLSTKIASASVDLSGTSTDNYWVVGNATFDTNNIGVADQLLSTNLRTSFGQLVLVNTADLPIGFVSTPTTYAFTDADFSNGTQIIDTWYYGDGTDPKLWASVVKDVVDASGAFGGKSFPDGAATPFPFSADASVSQLAAAPGISVAATPGAANSANVNDWSVY